MKSLGTDLLTKEDREVALQLNTLLGSRVDTKFSHPYYVKPSVPRLSNEVALILERTVQIYRSREKVDVKKVSRATVELSRFGSYIHQQCYTPTANILRSNNPLGNEECGGVQQSIHNAKVDLADIDHGISSVQLEIDRLLKELSRRNTLQRSKQVEIDSLYALISPARLLPCEVLGRIFLESEFHPSPKLCETSPLLLSHVCSAWRRAALRVSSLWNRLELNTYAYATLPGFIPEIGEILPRTREPTVLGDLLATWFGRATKNNKISLSLTTCGSARLLQKEATIHLAEKLLELSPHFSDLSLEDHCDVISSFFQAPAGRLTALKKLHLKFDGARTPASVTVFKGALHLTDVHLQVNASTHNRFSLPWSRLTNLTVEGEMTLPGFCEMIYNCTALHVARFTSIDLSNMGGHDILSPRIPRHTTLPHLTDLVLEIYGSHFMASYMGYPAVVHMLYLPKLEKLCLAGSLTDPSRPPLPRFDPGNLRVLALLEVGVGLPTFPEILRATPLIEEITLCISTVSAVQLLQALASEDITGGGRLECLKKFQFVYCPDESHTLEDYTEVGNEFSALVGRWMVAQSSLVYAALVVYETKTHHEMLDVAHGLCEMARQCGRADFRAEKKVVHRFGELKRALGLHDLRGP
ncbi:hypothetical protein H0H81_008164 [Sphagnurus paluster]|uniref:F-box domain-containing protein n=1 Tax=Sphagnurus paluster TaxID=117069 RepID=A0A9P7GJ34_9AGAR|nr:hypothetical protein H0H81_008164 [Sphagnurus paluster]